MIVKVREGSEDALARRQYFWSKVRNDRSNHATEIAHDWTDSVSVRHRTPTRAARVRRNKPGTAYKSRNAGRRYVAAALSSGAIAAACNAQLDFALPLKLGCARRLLTGADAVT